MSGAHIGRITSASGTFEATVYYLKLSLPMSIDAALSKGRAWEDSANAEHDRVFAALEDGRKHEDGKSWRCDNLAPLKADLGMLATREMRIFVPKENLGMMKIPRTWKTYPQGSTFNLSYNLSRTVALVGVGHFLGTELATLIQSRGTP